MAFLPRNRRSRDRGGSPAFHQEGFASKSTVVHAYQRIVDNEMPLDVEVANPAASEVRSRIIMARASPKASVGSAFRLRFTVPARCAPSPCAAPHGGPAQSVRPREARPAAGARHHRACLDVAPRTQPQRRPNRYFLVATNTSPAAATQSRAVARHTPNTPSSGSASVLTSSAPAAAPRKSAV